MDQSGNQKGKSASGCQMFGTQATLDAMACTYQKTTLSWEGHYSHKVALASVFTWAAFQLQWRTPAHFTSCCCCLGGTWGIFN